MFMDNSVENEDGEVTPPPTLQNIRKLIPPPLSTQVKMKMVKKTPHTGTSPPSQLLEIRASKPTIMRYSQRQTSVIGIPTTIMQSARETADVKKGNLDEN